MMIKVCPNGHRYNGDDYDVCPYCKGDHLFRFEFFFTRELSEWIDIYKCTDNKVVLFCYNEETGEFESRKPKYFYMPLSETEKIKTFISEIGNREKTDKDSAENIDYVRCIAYQNEEENFSSGICDISFHNNRDKIAELQAIIKNLWQKYAPNEFDPTMWKGKSLFQFDESAFFGTHEWIDIDKSIDNEECLIVAFKNSNQHSDRLRRQKPKPFTMPLSEMEKIKTFISEIRNWEKTYKESAEKPSYAWSVDYQYGGELFSSEGFDSYPENYGEKIDDLWTIIKNLWQKYAPDEYDPTMCKGKSLFRFSKSDNFDIYQWIDIDKSIENEEYLIVDFKYSDQLRRQKPKPFTMPLSEMEKIKTFISEIRNWEKTYKESAEKNSHAWNIDYQYGGELFSSEGFDSYPENYGEKIDNLWTIIKNLWQKYAPGEYDPTMWKGKSLFQFDGSAFFGPHERIDIYKSFGNEEYLIVEFYYSDSSWAFNTKKFPMPLSELEKITAFITGINNWKKDYKCSFDITDGYAWHIYYKYEGVNFSSSGYESFPENYGEKIDDLWTIIKNLWQKYAPDEYDPTILKESTSYRKTNYKEIGEIQTIDNDLQQEYDRVIDDTNILHKFKAFFRNIKNKMSDRK